jgi:hypothetical protein
VDGWNFDAVSGPPPGGVLWEVKTNNMAKCGTFCQQRLLPIWLAHDMNQLQERYPSAQMCEYSVVLAVGDPAYGALLSSAGGYDVLLVGPPYCLSP